MQLTTKQSLQIPFRRELSRRVGWGFGIQPYRDVFVFLLREGQGKKQFSLRLTFRVTFCLDTKSTKKVKAA